MTSEVMFGLKIQHKKLWNLDITSETTINCLKNTFIGLVNTSHHSCAWHAPNAAENIQPFTFDQIPSSQLAWFQRMSSYSKRTEQSRLCTGEHIWSDCFGRKKWADGPSVCLLEELLNVSVDVAGEELPAVTLEGNSVRPNEELLEVPGHVIPADRAPDDQLGVSHQGGWLVAGERELFPQEHKQGMGILSINVYLLQELELWLEAISRTDVLQGHEDFIILAVLLHGLIKGLGEELWHTQTTIQIFWQNQINECIHLPVDIHSIAGVWRTLCEGKWYEETIKQHD